MTTEMQEVMIATLADLKKAHEECQEAVRLESQARTRRCDAVNKLNAVQKRFDKLVEGMRQVAPMESDWWRSLAVVTKRTV